ncbi:MAG: ATP-binding protein [Magnetococcales bacterium]|nr:ATP-binding protein [Magnetococcales bacterium]
MKNKLVNTQNVKLFLAGILELERRGAREANMLMVVGDAGYGKTITVRRWADMSDAIYLKGRPKLSPNQVMEDLIWELGEKPKHTIGRMEKQARRLLMASQQPIVLDEAHFYLTDKASPLEMIRAVTETSENAVILVSTEEIQTTIRHFPPLWSRVIPTVVRMNPASLEDVSLFCSDLCEVTVADDLVREIYHHTEGRYRVIKNAVAIVEQFARRNRLERVTTADMVGEVIAHDWRDRSPLKVRKAKSRAKPRAGSV